MKPSIRLPSPANLTVAACAAAAGLATLLPGVASAAPTISTYTNRAAFQPVAGPVKTETFEGITSDVELSTTSYRVGDFTLAGKQSGNLPTSRIEAPPFAPGAGTVNGTTHIFSPVRDFGSSYASLVFTFDEAITAFGANFISTNGGQIEMFVDGMQVLGQAGVGGFFGFTSDTAFSTLELRARAGSGYNYAVDDVTFSTSAVPEPATWALMIGGFMLIGATLRRRDPAVRLRFGQA